MAPGRNRRDSCAWLSLTTRNLLHRLEQLCRICYQAVKPISNIPESELTEGFDVRDPV